MSYSDLFVIGNGFDLAHKMPNKYDDFTIWLLENDRIDVIQELQHAFPCIKDGEYLLWSDFQIAWVSMTLNRSSIYPALPHRLAHSRYGRRYISHLPAGLWRGRMPYHMPSHPAAREPGRGAPQACVPADGQ